MASPTLQQVFDAARSYLGDTQVPGGEVFTNSILQQCFNEPYRTMFSCLMGVSKRVQRVVYVNLPADTTVLIPSTYNITDMAEPEMVEERPGGALVTITSTDTSTPVIVTATNHGLTSNAEVIISGVAGSTAAWGQWFVTVLDANRFTLNGSASDGAAGTGGSFTLTTQQPFSEVYPIDLSAAGLDGIPSSYLGVYLWINSRMQFRGATQTQQLRITYYASGAPPVLSNMNLGIDNCIDFLAVATAANAARPKGWPIWQDLVVKAFGDQGESCTGGLLGKFTAIQVASLQRGPQRRRLPFREKRSRWGSFVIG